MQTWQMINLNEVEENEEDCHSQFRSKYFEEYVQIRFEERNERTRYCSDRRTQTSFFV